MTASIVKNIFIKTTRKYWSKLKKISYCVRKLQSDCTNTKNTEFTTNKKMIENNTDAETDSTDEEVEPKLKFTRIANDLRNILAKDAVSCVTIHSRFMCLGTHLGAVYLLDHQGNMVDVSMDNKLKFSSHLISVNQISVDSRGEYIGTCSDDAMAIINGLYTEENNQKINIGHAVKSIALDPQYHKSGSGRKFIIGDNKVTLYEKTFLQGLKTTLLSEAEGAVSAIAWCDQFVAWANQWSLRVYDLNEKCSLGSIKWEEPDNGQPLSEFRCNLRWSNSTTLLIGWVDTIRVCIVRKRNSVEVSSRGLPAYIVDPVSTFQTDFFICGLAPLSNDQLIVLGYPKERDEISGKALRPVLCVMQFRASDYEEICIDSLSLRGYAEYRCNDYHLDCLIEENQYFVVAPKDIVVASLYENDDRVQWLIEHAKFEQAMEVISQHGGKYSFVSVARLYLDHLLELGEYENAAKQCVRAFGEDKLLWEEEVYKFVNVQQLRSVSKYLPRTNNCKLNPHIYEMVLYEYLRLDCLGFLNLIKEWSPALYNTSAVINAISNHIEAEKNKNILLEALAILYSYEGKYDRALTMYIKLQSKDVFDLIKKHNLYGVIHRMIDGLIALDRKKAIDMLVEKNKISPDIVVQQLEHHQEYLFWYLDALDKVDSGKFDKKLLNLYAKYDPDKLLSFLKRANSYVLEEALELCESKRLYPEVVYLYEKMGNNQKALSIILQDLNDIDKAIDFCKEKADEDLWISIINQSLEKPANMTKLLDVIAGFINPVILVDKIKMGVEIPELKRSLIKMLCDYSLQVSIADGCNNILERDYFSLHQKLYKYQQKAVFVSGNNMCGLCPRDIFIKDSQKSDIIVFNCRHLFHASCLPESSNLDFCIICKSEKQ